MKKIYGTSSIINCVIIAFCFVCTSGSLFGQLPFSDGFESGGFTSGGWIITGNAQISSQSPSQGNYCVEGPSQYSIQKEISSITENVVLVEYSMKASQTGSNCCNLEISDISFNISALVFFRHTGFIVAYDGQGSSQQIDLIPYEADTWYSIKIELDMNNKTYDVYVDNQLEADDFDFYSLDFTTPYKFSWESGETWGIGWVDNVNISGEINPTNLPFQDCFESGSFTSGGWFVDGNAEISTQSPAQGSYCVKGPGTYSISKQISSINENIVTIEYDMKASQTGSNCVNLKVEDFDENLSSVVFFRHNGNIVAYDGEGSSQQIDLMPYNADTWYSIKIDLDMANKTYDVFIDEEHKADDFDFVSMDFTMPYSFSWSSGETWGTGWIDCVNIYAGIVGIDDEFANAKNISIYPNPVVNILNIKGENVNSCNIYSIKGNLVKTTFFKNTNNQIDISNLPSGMYLLKLMDKNGNLLKSEKIIKE